MWRSPVFDRRQMSRPFFGSTRWNPPEEESVTRFESVVSPTRTTGAVMRSTTGPPPGTLEAIGPRAWGSVTPVERAGGFEGGFDGVFDGAFAAAASARSAAPAAATATAITIPAARATFTSARMHLSR